MQTNEPARRATLLPVLARLPQPLALIEVGASAGLCLMADRYGYDYRRGLVRPSVDQLDPPVFSCVVTATTPVPTAPPRVTWRAGLDLDPVDPMIAARAARRGREVGSLWLCMGLRWVGLYLTARSSTCALNYRSR